jgi:L-alanine-DL-glutamate epimerase-like enolase superfamily enzyme
MVYLDQLLITDIRAVEVRNVPFSVGLIPPWNPTQRITTRDYCVIRVDTNQGIYGISLDGDYTPAVPATAQTVHDIIAPYLIGKRVMDIDWDMGWLRRIGLT